MNTTSSPFHIPASRRVLLRSLLAATGGLITSELYAEALTLTPRQTEGPYYPDHLPLEQDNDLVRMLDGKAPAGGLVTEFGGRLLNADGKPIAEAVIELWQADTHGCYIHSRGVPKGRERDPLFQGFGKITTNAKGEYRFRTIKPGLYTGRTRHYHIAVLQNGRRMLTTQLYLAGEPGNDQDRFLSGIRDEARRLSLIADFQPQGENLVAAWDIVIGSTPEDPVRRPGPPAKK